MCSGTHFDGVIVSCRSLPVPETVAVYCDFEYFCHGDNAESTKILRSF